MTAIIGGTGSGKSTLINLIPRFYDVESGAVLVDGVDVRQMPQDGSAAARSATFRRKAVLFSGTIADNIRYGKEDATEEELLRGGGDGAGAGFYPGDGGRIRRDNRPGRQQFSGGQKQRLSIARALVRKPEIYVFDDSFSALDYKTDAKLRAALDEETKECNGDHRRTARKHSHRCGSDHRAGSRAACVGMGTHRAAAADL